MPGRMKDKVILVTGGTSGIGRATVELFASEGASVAFTGRRAELGRPLAEKLGAVYIQADQRQKEDCERAVAETLEAFGRIDILFNNAGIVVSGTAEIDDRSGLGGHTGAQRDRRMADEQAGACR